MLAEAVTQQCAGPDRVFGDDKAWGLGFAISGDGYGMGGLSKSRRHQHRQAAAQ